MTQKLNIPVSVILYFDHHRRRVVPVKVTVNQKNYIVTKLGLHHTYKQGTTLFHVFSVVADNVFLKLILDTSNLFWRLEEIVDGQSN